MRPTIPPRACIVYEQTMINDLKPGLYDSIITARFENLLAQLSDPLTPERARLDPGDAHERLARHVYEALRNVLGDLPGSDAERVQAQIELVNQLLTHVKALTGRNDVSDHMLPNRAATLQSIHIDRPGFTRPEPPLVPLSASALLVNDGERMSVGAAIRRELMSADRADLICAFINHTGVRILEQEIRSLIGRGGQFRVITTTYMGATQRQALDLLVAWGAQIRVAFETPPAHTKLHAKAWMFYRESSFHTAYIGSSNISHSALIDGLEWNVRLSRVDAEPILEKFRATFERYWNDAGFEPYDPERDSGRLDRALNVSTAREDTPLDLFFDIEPRPHQREILEALDVERQRRGKWHNLVVAATGTGKTVIAALDYRRLYRDWKEPSLLFVAHRREILNQSLHTFRTVLRDGAFGELWVDGARPEQFRHVFASIQSLSRTNLQQFAPEHFEFVIVDEFHHAEAETYRRLLDHIRPRLLLGLTATPERADGRDVRDMFGGESTVELRLWDALDQGLLCPFQYFGIADNTDLSRLNWREGRYDIADLETIFVQNGDTRAALVYEQMHKIVGDPSRMRALGFCVSIKHARFMADRFSTWGVKCKAIDSNTDSAERRESIGDLRSGRINIVFAVDIFNEGVDIPEVDTVLFLRPTESATIYIQQLGRGLRLCQDKACLTVLDFIGQQHQKFRFEFRYRALTGCSRVELQRQIEQGFPRLPAGCHMQLDRQATKTVLANLKASLPQRAPQMVAELRQLAARGIDTSLETFLCETGLEPGDLYSEDRYYTALKRRAGLIREQPGPLEAKLGSALIRLLAVDDPERSSYYPQILRRERPPQLTAIPVREQRMVFMLLASLIQDLKLPELEAALERFWQEERIREEIAELVPALARRSEALQQPLQAEGLDDVPLCLHAAYSRDEIMAALGRPKPRALREGVLYSDKHRCDVFLITLRKTEAHFSPTTRYQDYPISRELFHWESQSTTRADSPTGRRYVDHANLGSKVILLAREAKSSNGRTQPYTCLGTATYQSHEAERPMRITWKLDRPMPETLYQQFRAAAG